MIFWRGYGILVLIIGIVAMCVSMAILPSTEIEPDKTLMMSIAFGIGGIAVWLVGYAWNKEKIRWHEADQQYYRYKDQHSVYWIPVQYYGLFIMLISIAMTIPTEIYLATASMTVTYALAAGLPFIIQKNKKKGYHGHEQS